MSERSCSTRTTSSRTPAGSRKLVSISSTPSRIAASAATATVDLSSELRVVLSQHLTGGPARPPRPTDDLSDDPLSVELDAICADYGFSRLEELIDRRARQRSADALTEYERRVSADRRDRFDRLDTFSAELVRRYREGEASVDGLLGEF